MKENESRFAMTKKHHKETYEEAKKMGRMDQDLVKFCDFVAKSKNYYTASSCAGRIALIGLDKTESKQESAFYRKWHRTIKKEELLEAVKAFKGEVLWFKQEPLILHLGTNDLDNARKILILCEKAGIKRAGIKVAKDGKFMAELLGTHAISAPIKEGNYCVDEEYLKYLAEKANEKFKKNQELIKKLYKESRKILK